MRKILLASSVFASLALALPAVTFAANPTSTRASNINQSDTHSRVAPALPEPTVGPNASVGDYLNAAQSALSAGQTGLAQSSLAHAETLALTRSVPRGQAHVPDRSPLVSNINSALQALGHHDIASARHYTTLAQNGATGQAPSGTPMATAPGMGTSTPMGATTNQTGVNNSLGQHTPMGAASPKMRPGTPQGVPPKGATPSTGTTSGMSTPTY